MRPRYRALALIFALILTFSACSRDIPDEPVITVSATEEITEYFEESLFPETEDETVTEFPVETEEITTEPETTEIYGIRDLSADELLLATEALASHYRSFIRITHTESTIDMSGETVDTESDSELRVRDKNALFRRGKNGEFNNFYLSGGEFYYAGALGNYRVGGYNMNKFLTAVSDELPYSIFTSGEVSLGESNIELNFVQITKDGIELLREKLSLGDEYTLQILRSELYMLLDNKANLLESRTSLELSVSKSDEEIMSFSLESETEQSEINSDISLEMPDPDSYVLFTGDSAVELYEKSLPLIKNFTSDRQKFEYAVYDSMQIKGSGIDLVLNSDTVYAYSNKIGASIEKSFDRGDGTGRHNTLTHFNNRRGFSQIDGGNIFVDTTLNAKNLEFTLSYPFTTSFFGLENCTGMDPVTSTGRKPIFILGEKAAKNIASNLLLNAGIYTRDPILADGYKAYTYFELSQNGALKAIGYEFSAKATVSGKTYTLTQSVKLEIISSDSATVKVIYIDVEDDE